jgi:hypothetical protein
VPEKIPVADYRAFSAQFIDTITKVSIKVDGRTIRQIRRVRSPVFDVSLPESNVFDAICEGAGLGNFPAGVYSPAVDEGYYARLADLSVGPHTVQFAAENADGIVQSVTYKLTVVPVSSE